MVKVKAFLVTVPNEKLFNWLGEPLIMVTQEADGSTSRTHVDVVETVKNFLRSRDPQNGQSLVVKSLDDADHVRAIGLALVASTDGVLALPFGDHKWIVGKAKEVGFRFLPNDVSILIEALEAGQRANELVNEPVVD